MSCKIAFVHSAVDVSYINVSDVHPYPSLVRTSESRSTGGSYSADVFSPGEARREAQTRLLFYPRALTTLFGVFMIKLGWWKMFFSPNTGYCLYRQLETILFSLKKWIFGGFICHIGDSPSAQLTYSRNFQFRSVQNHSRWETTFRRSEA